MDPVLALRPFVPAKDFGLSRRFYQALGFSETHVDEDAVGMKLGSCGFILQRRPQVMAAEAPALQLLVRDVEAWWRAQTPEALAASFALRTPIPPSWQSWGMKVGFLFDPSGVVWHIAEAPF